MEEHYTMFWGHRRDDIGMENYPIEQVSPGFRILVFARGEGQFAYCTEGMSRNGDRERVEIFLLSRECVLGETLLEVIEVLCSIAHYHRTGPGLSMGHTVNFGQPIVAGASCDYGLLSLPYLDGPGMEYSRTGIRCLWLIPITKEEREFKARSGLFEFEEALQRANFDYLDWWRDSVVV